MTQNTEEIQRINARLKEVILRRVPEPGLYETAAEGLLLSRREEAGQPHHCVDKPLVSIIVQGEKQALMGSANLSYRANQILVVGVDMPNTFQITAASPEQPFLGVALHLDKRVIAELIAETAVVPEPETGTSEAGVGFGVSVSALDPLLMDAFLRLLEVLDTPARVPVLAPMLMREIHYLLLTGPQGEQLRHINTFGTQSNQVAKAISWIRDNFTQPVQIETLAHEVNMATSTFHRHFKEMTTMSPLQYLKRLRLYEAQRLMVVERHDANSAGLAVGYESSSQFNREYKRLFGEPPLRNVKRLR